MKLTMTLEGGKKVEVALNRVNIFTHDAVKVQTNTSAFNIDREAKKRCPVDHGRLRSAIRPTFFQDGMAAEIGPIDVDYAASVEFGTGPHEPPFGAILRWAKRRCKGDEDKAYAMAVGVVNAIKKNGTQPHPFLFPAWEEERPDYVRGIDEATKGAISRAAM